MNDKDQLACLEYLFIFNPADTWQHLYQFEDAFAKFLQEHGMEGKVLDSIDKGGSRRIIQIRPSLNPEDVSDADRNQATEEFMKIPPQKPKDQLKIMMKGFNGKS